MGLTDLADDSMRRGGLVPAFPRVRDGKRLGGKPGEIVVVARRMFEEAGVAATKMTAVADAVGMSRGLVYYYFPSKDRLVDAVVDDYVEDMVESAMVWNELRLFGDTPGSLRKCVQSFRRALFDANGPRPMIVVLEELGIRDEFDTRAIKETATYLYECVAVEYAEHHPLDIDHVFEMFCVALAGLVALVKIDPEVPDEVLMRAIEQTLHLDMRRIGREVAAG